MTSHDLLWKSLLQAFLHEFLEFVAPDLLETHRTRDPSFLDQEAAADLPRGRVSRLDVLARLRPLRTGSEPRLLLIHVEIERDFGTDMDARMWRYYRHLRLKYDEPVIPIVLFLSGGRGGVETRTARETLIGVEISTFTYWAFGLAGAQAVDYLGRNALSPALASCMSPELLGQARLKIRCLEDIVDLQLDEARKFLLVNAVETYLDLDEGESMDYAQRMSRSHHAQEIEEMELTWAGRLQRDAKADGVKEGEKLGRAKGSQKVIEAMLAEKFGALDGARRRKLRAIDDPEKLNEIGRRLLKAESWGELGLDD